MPHENLLEPSRNLYRPCPEPTRNLRRPTRTYAMCARNLPEPSRNLRRLCPTLSRPFPEPDPARNVPKTCRRLPGTWPGTCAAPAREPSGTFPEHPGTCADHARNFPGICPESTPTTLPPLLARDPKHRAIGNNLFCNLL